MLDFFTEKHSSLFRQSVSDANDRSRDISRIGNDPKN